MSGWVRPLKRGNGDAELRCWLATLNGNPPPHLSLISTKVTDAGVRAVAEHCPGLQTLSLTDTRVTDAGVVAVAEHCPGLQTLYLSETGVTDVGVVAVAEHCSGLQTLDLSYCRAVTDAGVRAVAQHCPGLQALDLSYCPEVTDAGVRVVAEHCPEVQFLNLWDTAVNLPKTLKGSPDARTIFRYFREAREVGARLVLEVKVCILGLGRLGKSQLSKRIAPRPGEPLYEPNAPRTHAFVQRQVTRRIRHGKQLHDCLLRLFDFGGQPEMHGSHRFFLADQRNVYVVVVSARLTAEGNRLGYWLRMVKVHGGGAPVVVVVTHNDEQPAADQPRYRTGKTLGTLNAAELAKVFGLSVRVVDGYSNATGVNFDKVCEALDAAVGEVKGVFDLTFTKHFFTVFGWLGGQAAAELQDQPPFERYCTEQRFRQVCHAAGQTDHAQQTIWLHLCRDLGLAHYVGDRPEYRRESPNKVAEYVFHPEWVKQPVYDVVTDPEALEANGMVTEGRLHAILSRSLEDKGERRRVVPLMQACGLIFPVRGGDHFLIVDRVRPAAVGWNRPGWTDCPRQRIRRTFDFLPEHLMPQLLGRWFHRHQGEYYRDDVAFESDDGRCEVRLKADLNAHAIEIQFATKTDEPWKLLLVELDGEMRDILASVRLWGNPWQDEAPDDAPPPLDRDEQTLAGQLAVAMANSVERVVDARAIETAILHGFEASADCKPVQQLAYRVCWVYACWLNWCGGGLPNGEVRPIARGKPTAGKVEKWLQEDAAIGALFTFPEWGNFAENLAKNYGFALDKIPTESMIYRSG